METNGAPKKQNQKTCAHSCQRQEQGYRVGLVLQVFGTALLAVLYPLGDPFYTAGIMLFEAGVLLAAGFVPFSTCWARGGIVLLVLTGMALQVYGLQAPEDAAGAIIIGGLGLVCAGAAGMVGREAHLHNYRESWALLLVAFPGLVLANLLFKENLIFNSIGFSILFLLMLLFTGKKIRSLIRS